MSQWQPLALADSFQCQIDSLLNDHSYRILVWRPTGISADTRLPVIYVLDGDDLFVTLTESVRRLSRRTPATHVGAAIVVGIETLNIATNGSQRSYDLTPGPAAEEDTGKRRCGGAHAFMQFICEQLVPLIEQEFPADPAKRCLFGHSLAGFFTLQLLAQKPAAFAHYVAISPSIWWDEPRLIQDLKQASLDQQRVFLAAGEWEEKLAPWQRGLPSAASVQQRRARRATPQRVSNMAAYLEQRLGKNRVANHQFADEDHASIVLVATARALRFVLGPGDDTAIDTNTGKKT